MKRYLLLVLTFLLIIIAPNIVRGTTYPCPIGRNVYTTWGGDLTLDFTSANTPLTAYAYFASDQVAAEKGKNFKGYLCGIGGDGFKPLADQQTWWGTSQYVLNVPVYLPKGINDKKLTLTGSPVKNQINGVYFFCVDGYSNLGYGDAKQVEESWSEVLYGFSTWIKIKNMGCHLCAIRNGLLKLGLDKTVEWWNDALKKELNGYMACYNKKKKKWGEKININNMAVVKIANDNSCPIGYKGFLSVAEGLSRDMVVINRVKDDTHSVLVTMHWNGASDYYIHDPMDITNRLSGYAGLNMTNTRCFYKKQVPVYYGAIAGGGMIACADEETTLELIKVGVSTLSATTTQISVARGELIKTMDDITGIVQTQGTILECPNADPGKYILRVSGYGEYYLSLLEYDEDYHEKQTVYEGDLGAGGSQDILINHDTLLRSSDVSYLTGVELGSRVGVTKGFITAVVPGGFYYQSAASRVPTFKVEYSGAVEAGQIASLNGVTVGSRLIKANSDGVTITGLGNPTPVGVTPEKVGTTFHLYASTWGKITASTSSGFTLNGTLEINYSDTTTLAVGQRVRVSGVEHEGKFYANKITGLN